MDVGGQEVRTSDDYELVERGMVPRQPVQVTILRRGAGGEDRVALTMTPVELSRERALQIGQSRFGLEVAESREGLVIQRVAPGSAARRVGIRRGDLLLAIGGQRLESKQQFAAICVATRTANAVAVVIGRGGRAYYVTLPLGEG